jgi:hypothetical protein
MYRNAHTFYMTTIMHWQSHSEMFGTRWHRLPYQVVPVALTAFPITDNNHDNFRDYSG